MKLKYILLLSLIFAQSSFSQSTDKDTTNTHGERIDTNTERTAFRSALMLGTAATTDSTAYDIAGAAAAAQAAAIAASDPVGSAAAAQAFAIQRANHTGTQSYTTITGLGTAATTNSTAYATAAQGALADTALQAAALTPYAPLASPSFTGNATFDTNTLFVDGANNRVGIGTASPTVALDVTSANATSARIDSTSGTISRFVLNHTAGSPNVGFWLAENGVNKWSIASYNGGDFVLFNDALSASALQIDSANNMRFFGPATFDYTIELGHASDTTLSRSAAGKLAVEGDIVSTLAADETHSGDRNLTGAVTIANQDTSVATSAMNLGMAKDLSFYEIGSVYRPSLVGFVLQASGTGASAAPSLSRVRLDPGTATSGHALAVITAQPHAVAYNIRFDRPAGVSLRLDINKTDATDTLNAFRLLWGEDGSYPAGDANAFTGKGMGLEIRSDGTNHRMRAISHDGSTYTTGSWVNFDTGDASDFSRMVAIETDGSGNITATISSQAGNRPFYTSTISGGVTGTGSGLASQVTALVVNDSTGTPTPVTYQITDCVIKSY